MALSYDYVTRAINKTLGNPSKGYFVLLGAEIGRASCRERV